MGLLRKAVALNPPVLLQGLVVHGFGRGSKTLGFPTANLEIKWNNDESTLSANEKDTVDFANSAKTGVYAGFACVADGKDRGVYKAAISVGWNPTFTDVKATTIEPWIMHKYNESFYGCQLRLVILAFIRPEKKFESIDELKQEIATDGDFCKALLDEQYSQFTAHDFFRGSETPESSKL